MNERSHVTGLLLQSGDGNCVSKSALQEVTVPETRKTANSVGDHVSGSLHTHTEEFARHRHVALRRTSSYQARALGGHDGESDFNVVMTFSRTQRHVMKGALGQRQGKSRVGTGRSSSVSPTRARRSEETWFLGSADFRGFGRHRGAHGAGR